VLGRTLKIDSPPDHIRQLAAQQCSAILFAGETAQRLFKIISGALIVERTDVEASRMKPIVSGYTGICD